ncbi:hypothetical protein HOU02_gp154 [Caulobacter phage CcrBL9]|uniref:Uncharacterized protein n=1 Tax=Caulobacter phage CcrBL9 TaxID=2283270 RepID=A0A385EDH3_9CAUD|nr:hypothetical protein HOU02_gp031 [Caulobacter phage CcrBL9]YP_009810201.1 hypothetical protein HOU02_gp154 [Caulobacter phage CcrBL9]AXQ69055.1 hypothetical protein CcrBL9_gp031 [Caulobacter phage CcrBL9]AXQ69571.1 hypothetical protein CcrBL9_gp547 [Caulobacter phage CcrBL9]
MDLTTFSASAEFVLCNKPVKITVKPAGRPLYLSFSIEQIGMIGGSDELMSEAEQHDVEDLVTVLTIADVLSLKPIETYNDEDRDAVESVRYALIMLNGERYASAVAFEDVGEADFSNRDDTIDTRQIVERVEVLRSALETAGVETGDLAALEALDEEEAVTDQDQRETFNEIREEYLILARMVEEGANYGEDWTFGATLVRESYFTEFAQEECESLGYIAKDFPSWISIDWEKTANTMKSDYTEIDFDGVSYYVRA